ncbi:MAG: efflux RND transporter periplasmic adaptor subunit [Pseudomonadota bacterium]
MTQRLTPHQPLAALGLLLLSSISWSITSANAPGAGAPPPPKVGVIEVQTHSLRQSVQFPAQIRAVEQVEVRSQVSGMLQSVHFTDGAHVEQGQLLYSIDRRPFAAEVAAAEGEVAQAEASLRLAIREAQRGQELARSQTLSREAIEQRDAAKQVAEANLRAAKARLETARINLDYTQIRAPISGRIERTLVTPGNIVTSPFGSATTLLSSITPTDSLYVYFQIDEATQRGFAAQNTGAPLGETVRVSLQGVVGSEEEAVIDYLAPTVNAKSGSRQARAKLKNATQRYAPGQFANVRMNTAQVFDNPAIPAAAVGMNQSRHFVMLVGADNKVQMRPVKLGPTINGLRPVLEGLKPGERIILEGLQRARPNTPVTPELIAAKPATGECKADNAQPKPSAPLNSCFSANKP